MSAEQMTGADVKRDLDLDYRTSLARAAIAMLDGEDLPEVREIEDLFADELSPMSPTPREAHLAKRRSDTQAALVAMRFGVDPVHLLRVCEYLGEIDPDEETGGLS